MRNVVQRVPGRVFGIGLNKTGTRSVAAALRTLGLRTLHRGDEATSRAVDVAAESGRPLLDVFGGHFDAYFDVQGLVTRFRDLDEQYPGSKFILTTRDEERWLASRTAHVIANQERKARGDYAGHWLDVDVDAWRAERAAHHGSVMGHFADRPTDLLVFDVSRHGWDELAPFLGVAVPRRDFPHENRAGAGTYRPHGRAELIKRRVAAVGVGLPGRLGRRLAG